MGIETIRLSRLEANLRAILDESANSGRLVVVELPDQRLVAIQPLEPSEDDDLTDELLQSNANFQRLVAKSAASKRKPFPPGTGS
ncbi:MAG TPA: hypothetical protein VKD90_12010 [Gemmataceae bacterium]|nr:hypothetical protein [Gemmataceae bacterium]